jgi:hypothetical protein
MVDGDAGGGEVVEDLGRCVAVCGERGDFRWCACY